MSDAVPLCVVARADATADIGAGHVMRCLALAEANVERGGRSIIVGVCESEGVRERIRQAGVEFVPLAAGLATPEDAVATRARLAVIARAETRPAWLVVDGYQFDSAYAAGATPERTRRMRIVDSAVTAGGVDVLLNQNVGAAELEYPDSQTSVRLMGPSYALLRSEIRTARRLTGSGSGTRVLITLGGADADDASSRILRALAGFDAAIEARVLVGAMNPRAGALRGLAEAAPFPVEVLQSPSDVAEKMAWADVAIAAAGSTAYELASIGAALILVTTADNQVAVAEGLAAEQAALTLGAIQCVSDEALVDAVRSVVFDASLRHRLSKNAQRMVDGNGCARVLNVLEALSSGDLVDRLLIRPATAADARALLRLANEPSVRARSFTRDSISLEQHVRWLEGKLTSPHTRLLVAELESVLVGQLRYDLMQDGLEIGISVSSAFRGHGVATSLLDRTWVDAARSFGVERVYGLVMVDNPASLRAFEKAGFTRVGRTVRAGHECIVVERIATFSE